MLVRQLLSETEAQMMRPFSATKRHNWFRPAYCCWIHRAGDLQLPGLIAPGVHSHRRCGLPWLFDRVVMGR